MPKKQKNRDKEHVETGMVVEATKGDLGEDDISKPKVSAVTRNKAGEIEALTVQKGVIFKKTLDIPADRIQAVDRDRQDEKNAGKVVVDVGKAEAAALTAVGEEALSSEEEKGLLDTVEREVPTAEGLRELEARNTARRSKRERAQEVEEDAQLSLQESSPQVSEGNETQPAPPKKPANFIFRVLGPGFLGGMAGNDASAVGAYSVDGATNG